MTASELCGAVIERRCIYHQGLNFPTGSRIIGHQQDDNRQDGGVNKKIRWSPGVAREIRRSTGRAKPHERPGEIKRIVHAAEDQSLEASAKPPARAKGAETSQSRSRAVIGEAEKQRSEQKPVSEIEQIDKYERFQTRLRETPNEIQNSARSRLVPADPSEKIVLWSRNQSAARLATVERKMTIPAASDCAKRRVHGNAGLKRSN